MSTFFKDKHKITELDFGFKIGLMLSLLFIGAYILSLRSQLSLQQVFTMTAGYFMFWGFMHNLNKKENRKIAKNFLYAQSIIIFLGMLIYFGLLESLFLSLLSVFAFSMGCLAISVYKWIVIKLGLCEE